jgi:putative sporulation protein YyaC
MKRYTIDKEELTAALKDELPSYYAENYIFACIGTDRSTGDALGPIVGSKLEALGYSVIGTLDDPLHAVNLVERTENFPQDKVVIAIDACLGQLKSVGKVCFADRPIKPGAGVKKKLPPVGDYALEGIVNIGGFMEHFVLQNTRLSLVMRMADTIVNAIADVITTQPFEEVAVTNEITHEKYEMAHLHWEHEQEIEKATYIEQAAGK